MSTSAAPDLARPNALRRWAAAFVRAPDYQANAADLRTISIAGVEVPFRVAVAISVVTFAILFDYSRTFIPRSIQDLGLAAEAMRYQSIERLVLFGLVPLTVVVLVFRDHPGRYGLRLGDWRWGLSLVVIGAVLMTPVVVALVQLPPFRGYYAA